MIAPVVMNAQLLAVVASGDERHNRLLEELASSGVGPAERAPVERVRRVRGIATTRGIAMRPRLLPRGSRRSRAGRLPAQPRQNGWRFPAEDAAALETVVTTVHAARDRLPELGRRSRAITVDRADWDANFPRLLEAYRLALAAGAAP